MENYYSCSDRTNEGENEGSGNAIGLKFGSRSHTQSHTLNLKIPFLMALYRNAKWIMPFNLLWTVRMMLKLADTISRSLFAI